MVKNKSIVIAILVDALGWHLVKKHQFLTDIAPYRCGTRTVLGFSSSAIPTVLTGKHGNEINLWNTIYYSPATSPFKWLKWLLWLPKPLLENRYSRFVIRKFSRILSGYSGYFSDFNIPVQFLPKFDLCEKRKIYAPGGIDGNCSIFDDLHKFNFPFQVYSYLHSSDEKIFTQAKLDIKNGKSQFSFLYLCELDAFLHQHVGNDRAEAEKLKWYEDKITELYNEALTDYEDVILHIFSDHGMVPTEKNYDIMAEIGQLGYREGKDYMAMYDSTMARFWFFNPQCGKSVHNLLQSLNVGQIVDQQDLINEGAYFEDNRFGELIFLMNPSILIVPSYMSHNTVPGMHGFDPENKYMEASYISNHKPKTYPSHIKDIKAILLDDIV